MTANSKLREAMYWISVDSWHRINKDGQFELTEEAPERAVKSFELWCKIKKLLRNQMRIPKNSKKNLQKSTKTIKASRTEVLFSYPDQGKTGEGWKPRINKPWVRRSYIVQ